MATESLEQRFKEIEKKVDSLEETNKKQQHEIERLQAINEISNLFSKQRYMVMAGLQKEQVDMYSTDPGTRIYWGDQGYWEGSDAAKRNRAVYGARSEEQRTGMMAFHPISTPVIIVAGDGKTAKGVWIAAGWVASKNRETGEPRCGWEFDKYGIDFIKEDGKWKFWHFHIYRILHGCGWDDKWAEQFSRPEMAPMEYPEGLGPDGPAVDDNPYRPDTLQRLVPVPPESYETFDPKDMY